MTPEQRELRDALAAVPDRAASAALARAASRPGSPARVAPDDATASGEWSAREVALHLAAVEGEVWHTRLAALATETFPHWAWVEPDLWSGLGDGVDYLPCSGPLWATAIHGVDGRKRFPKPGVAGPIPAEGTKKCRVPGDAGHSGVT